MSEKSRSSVQSVDRALTLLSSFTSTNPSWTVTELANTTGLHKSVVARLLATMAKHGYLVQDHSTKRYSIGPQAFAVGSAYQPYSVFHQITRPVMDDLTRRTGHSTTIGVPAGDYFIIIDAFESRSTIRVAFEIGERPPYHAAAIGKLLLAYMPRERALNLVGQDPLKQVTPHTITTAEKLAEELDRIHKVGYSISDEESIVGVGSVAAPIMNTLNECIAGISVVYPAHVVTTEQIEGIVTSTVGAAALISSQLGTFAAMGHPAHRSLASLP